MVSPVQCNAIKWLKRNKENLYLPTSRHDYKTLLGSKSLNSRVSSYLGNTYV